MESCASLCMIPLWFKSCCPVWRRRALVLWHHEPPWSHRMITGACLSFGRLRSDGHPAVAKKGACTVAPRTSVVPPVREDDYGGVLEIVHCSVVAQVLLPPCSSRNGEEGSLRRGGGGISSLGRPRSIFLHA